MTPAAICGLQARLQQHRALMLLSLMPSYALACQQRCRPYPGYHRHTQRRQAVQAQAPQAQAVQAREPVLAWALVQAWVLGLAPAEGRVHLEQGQPASQFF